MAWFSLKLCRIDFFSLNGHLCNSCILKGERLSNCALLLNIVTALFRKVPFSKIKYISLSRSSKEIRNHFKYLQEKKLNTGIVYTGDREAKTKTGLYQQREK